ncbi:type II CAAX prenyl endopeptidase Rce1 family protein [Bacteroidota bacterium]
MSEFENKPDPEDKKEENEQKDFNGYRKSVYDTYPLLSPYAAALLGLIGGFFLYQFVGGLLTIIIFGFDIEHAPVDSLRLMTTAGQILFMLLPALLFARWVYGDVSDIILVKLPKWRELVLFSVGIVILTPLLQSYLYVQNYLIEYFADSWSFIHSIKNIFDSLNQLVEKTYSNLLQADSLPEMIFVVIIVAAIPALCEEVMFRGYIQRSFEFKLKPFNAALITAVFFGLFHFNPYGLLPLIVLGLYFGFASYMSKSLVIPIFLHFLNNFIAVTLFFIIGEEEIINSESLDTAGLEANIFLFFLLTIIFAIIVLIIKKYYLKLSAD